MSKKILMIGIDSMDRDIISKYLEFLPNFRSIIKNSAKVKSTSVFPPDSDTAWTSIYTGLNPAKHGVVNFVDPLEKASCQDSNQIIQSSIKGKTFWDIAGKKGKRVCVIFPHVVYPIWPVNGFMIVPKPDEDGFEQYPTDFDINLDLKSLEVPRRIPNSESEYQTYLNKFTEIVRGEFNFAEKMLLNSKWDLFFFYSSALDFIEHIFWNYCDPNDPSYPGDNLFKNAIRDFYILHDNLIGSLIQNVDKDTAIIILSDHGHSMRPVNLFNTNEVLRRGGYLFPKGGIITPLYTLNESFKRYAVNLVQKTGLRETALKILRKNSAIKDFYTKPSSIDFEKSIAHCTDLSGMKSYTYGGIRIYKNKLPNEAEYNEARKNIIAALTRYKIPNSNESIIEWICEREKVYSGPYIKKYPDILFKLKEGYGAGWAINTSIFSKAVAHSLFPGSHRGDTPILFILNTGSEKKVTRSGVNLMDIAPITLDIMGIDWTEYDFDGKTIFN